MTTRERLSAAGLANHFEAAVQARDTDTMVALLQKVDVAYPESRAIAEAITANPEKYKF